VGEESKSFLSFRLPFQILSYVCVIDSLTMHPRTSIPSLGGVASAPVAKRVYKIHPASLMPDRKPRLRPGIFVHAGRHAAPGLPDIRLPDSSVSPAMAAKGNTVQRPSYRNHANPSILQILIQTTYK
jgi:hypothetical protein